MYSETKYVHLNGIHGSTTEKFLTKTFWGKWSVCAAWVYILWLNIHFWVCQIYIVGRMDTSYTILLNIMYLHIYGTLLWHPHNKKFVYFWKSAFLRVKKWQNRRFWMLPLNFLVCDVSICPIIYIWLTQKCILRQSICTHVAHILHFPEKISCVPFGCAHFVSLYICERFSYGSLSLQSISFLCKWKCKSGGKIYYQFCREGFPAFHIYNISQYHRK